MHLDELQWVCQLHSVNSLSELCIAVPTTIKIKPSICSCYLLHRNNAYFKVQEKQHTDYFSYAACSAARIRIIEINSSFIVRNRDVDVDKRFLVCVSSFIEHVSSIAISKHSSLVLKARRLQPAGRLAC